MTRTLLIALAAGLVLPGTAFAFESDRIDVTVAGAGEPVVLIPGMGSSPKVWAELVDDVPGYSFHVIAVQGFGGLPAAGNAEGEVLAPVVEEIARYLGEEQLDDVALIGHSMGGIAAVMVAARQPDAVARVMTVDAPAFFAEIMGATADSVVPMADGIRQQSLSLDDAAYTAQQSAFAVASVIDEAGAKLVGADLLASDRAVATQAMYDVMVADIRDDLATVTVPVTVVFALPAAAPGMTPEQIEGFYASQYGAASELSLQFVPDAAHFVMLDQPDVFAALVTEFLR